MLLQLDGTLIVLIISFIIFMFIMQKIFYAPVRELKEERKHYIENNKAMAEQIKREAEVILKDYNSKIISTKLKANKIALNSTLQANNTKSAILQKKLEQVNSRINSYKQYIDHDKNEAKEALKTQVASLAQSISAKILDEEVAISGITSEVIDKAMGR